MGRTRKTLLLVCSDHDHAIAIAAIVNNNEFYSFDVIHAADIAGVIEQLEHNEVNLVLADAREEPVEQVFFDELSSHVMEIPTLAICWHVERFCNDLWSDTISDAISCEDLSPELLVRGLTTVCAVADMVHATEGMRRAERMAALGTLASGVAHEFNNINAMILGFAELLIDRDDLPAEAQSHMGIIHQSAKRAADITNGLLAFARKQSEDKNHVNLGQLAIDTVKIVRREFESRGVEFSLSLHDRSTVFANASQVGQVIMNLIINADHAMAKCAERKLVIASAEREGMVDLSISDTGCGIPLELQSKIFQPFFTTKTAKSKDADDETREGSGLGLSISSAIIREHDGELRMASQVGKGTTFTISLPSAVVEEEVVAEVEPPRTPLSGPARIMIIDDEIGVRMLLREMMQALGAEVEDTDDGQEALDRIQEADFDLVLLDMQMPKMNGFDLLENLRKLPADVQPAAAVMSGHLTPENNERLKEFGVLDALSKPFQLSKLAEVLHRAQQLRVDDTND